MPDEDRNWFLHLWIPQLDKGGSRSRVYRDLGNELRGFEDVIRLSEIRVHSTSDPILQAMRAFISVGDSDMWLADNIVNGIAIPDMLLLRSP